MSQDVSLVIVKSFGRHRFTLASPARYRGVIFRNKTRSQDHTCSYVNMHSGLRRCKSELTKIRRRDPFPKPQAQHRLIHAEDQHGLMHVSVSIDAQEAASKTYMHQLEDICSRPKASFLAALVWATPWHDRCLASVIISGLDFRERP